MDRQTTQQPRTRSQIRRAQRAAARGRKAQGQQPRSGQKPSRSSTPRKVTQQHVWLPTLGKQPAAVVADLSSSILTVIAAWCNTPEYKKIVSGSPISTYRAAFEVFAAGTELDMVEFGKAMKKTDIAFTTIATTIATHAISSLTTDVFAVFGLKIGSSEKKTLENLGWLQKETGKVTRVAFGRRTSRESVFSALIQVDDGQMAKLEGSQPKSSSLTGISLVESMLVSASSPIAQLKSYCHYESRLARLNASSGIGGSASSLKKAVG